MYDLTSDLEPAGVPDGFWGESAVPRHGRFLTSMSLVLKAQQAMRDQVLRDISVTTYSSKMVRPAYTAPGATERIFDLDGESYNVRERPPSYFALESERIKQQAQAEVA